MKDPEQNNSLPSIPGSLGHASTPEAKMNGAAGAPLLAGFTGQPDDLHDLFATTPDFDGPDQEDPLAALRNDPNYAALIRDLEYIATQARLLFEPAEEAPSDTVWDKIRTQLPTAEETGE